MRTCLLFAEVQCYVTVKFERAYSLQRFNAISVFKVYLVKLNSFKSTVEEI